MVLCSFVNPMRFSSIYYIDPSGNDGTGTGSISLPWKTLYKACNTVSGSGDIIHVNAGTYTETLTSILAPGVSIEGVGPTSILKSSFSTIYNPIIQCNSAEGTNGNQHISFIKIDGQSATSWGIQIQGRSNFSIHNCVFMDIAQRGIVWGGRADNSDGAPGTFATGNTFYNNTITNCSSFDGTYGYGCLNIGGQDGMLIHDNSIINNVGSTPGWPIKFWNGGYLNNCKIYSNTLKRPSFPYASNGTSGYFDFAIELFYESGLEVYNNIIEGATDVNFQTKGAYAYSLYFHDNTVGETTVAVNWEDGVILEFSSEYVRIEHNTFRNLTHPLFWSLRPGTSMNNIEIKNNLAYNIGNAAGNLYGYFNRIDVNDGSQNYTTSNFNMQFNTALAYGPATPYFGVRIPAGTSSTNVTISNNIISGFSSSALNADPAGNISGLTVRNNILYNLSAINLTGTPGTYTNTGNLSSNPNLNSTGNLFIPNTGSPANHGATDGTTIGYTGGATLSSNRAYNFKYPFFKH